MDRCPHLAIWLGDRLSLKNPVANVHNRLRRFADMLFERQNQLGGYGHLEYRLTRRFGLVTGQAQPTVQHAEVIGRRGHNSGLMVM